MLNNDENSVVHDYSALEAATGRKNAGSKARLYISSGLGLLLAGTGIGLAAYGLSFVIPPRIVETTKVIETTKVEKIEVPKIVEQERVRIVEVPKFIGGVETRVSESVSRTTKPTNTPETPLETPLETRTSAQIDSQSESQNQNPINNRVAQLPPTETLRPGAAYTPESFKRTLTYQRGQCAGRLVSHINGWMTFDNGGRCYDATPDGQVDIRTTSTRHNGDLAVCGETGKHFQNGNRVVDCFALHDGWVENIREKTAADTASRNDPIQELMNPN